MPTLPLPPIATLDGDVPVSSEEDILVILPAFLRPEINDATLTSPVRDAIVAALVAMMEKYQLLSSESVGMSDVLRALDSALESLGSDRGVFKQENETNTSYRTRILSIPDQVTPEAIVAAVNTLLAPHTDIECQYSESVQDRWYVGTSAPRPWHSYVWDETMSMSPGYPDRLYEDDQDANLGYFRSNSNPGGARVYKDAVGRLFLLRIPDISSVDELGAFANSTSLEHRFYVGGVGVSSGIRVSGTTATDLFNTIVSTINRIKGHSIRFVVWADPKLQS